MDCDKLDKSVIEAIRMSKELKLKEQEEYVKSFIEERNKILVAENNKPKKKSNYHSIIKCVSVEEPEINCLSENEDVKETILEELVKPIVEEVKPIVEEVKPKLISVKKAPYDMKPSNASIKIEELENKIADMQVKYNKLVKKHSKLNEVHHKYKEFYEKYHTDEDGKVLANYITNNYEITNNRSDKIKCVDLFNEFIEVDKSYTIQSFVKALEVMNIKKCQKNGANHFYCLKKKE